MSTVRLQHSVSPSPQVSAAFMVDTSGVIAISTPQARITSRVTLTSKALEAAVVVAAMVILVVIRTAPVKSKVIISGVDQARDQRTIITALSRLMQMVNLPPLRLKALLCMSVFMGIRLKIVPRVTFNCLREIYFWVT